MLGVLNRGHHTLYKVLVSLLFENAYNFKYLCSCGFLQQVLGELSQKL